MQICLLDRRRDWPGKATGKKGPFVDEFSQFDFIGNILLVCAIWINTKYADPENSHMTRFNSLAVSDELLIRKDEL